MSNKFRYASAISVAATCITILASTGGSGAKAQDLQIPVIEAPGASAVQTSSQAAIAPQVEAALPTPEIAEPQSAAATGADARTASSLAALVEQTAIPAALSDELNCLAGAIYFEAKSETLAGQLAVGRVVVARANSGRFPSSYCGVVFQPSQFSFVQRRAMPPIRKDSRDWADAVRIALIADKGMWKSPTEGAMFFHAAHVSPRWGKTRLARIDNHVFYR